MNFKNWLFTEEIWQNNTATVYHRTRPESIATILSTNWKTAEGCMYGCGLYTTFSIESQFNSYMKRYGTSILKFKVTNLDQYVICQKSVAQQILGQNYKISDQLKKLNLTDLYKPEQIDQFDSMMETVKFSAELALKMYQANTNLQNKAKGIIYYGSHDGYCLVKYPPIEDGTITMLGYANDVSTDDLAKMQELETNCKKNEQGKCESPWITSTSKVAVKTLYGLEKDKKLEYILQDLSGPELIDVLKSIKDPYPIFEKFGSNLVDKVHCVYHWSGFPNALNSPAIIKGMFQYKKNLDDLEVFSMLGVDVIDLDEIKKYIKKDDLNKLQDIQVFHLINNSVDAEPMAKLLGPENLTKLDANSLEVWTNDKDREKLYAVLKNIGSLSEKIIRQIISIPGEYQITDEYNKDELIHKIIQYIPNLSPLAVANMLWFAYDKKEIADALGKENIDKISDEHIKVLTTTQHIHINDEAKDDLKKIFQKYGRIPSE